MVWSESTEARAVQCIICRKEKPERVGVGEHPIPLSIGGSWTIDRVCEDCDNEFGASYDADLAKITAIEKRRIALNLAGHSGAVPNREREALSRPVRVAGTDRFMKVSMDPSGRITRKHAIPHVKFVIEMTPEGEWFVSLPPENVAIDPSDVPKAEKILARHLREALTEKGLTPTDDQVRDVAAQFAQNLEPVFEDTAVELRMPVRTSGHVPGLLKTAYEVAWWLLGDTWLDDPAAIEMNRSLHGDRTARVRGDLNDGTRPRFNLQGMDPESVHIVMLRRAGNAGVVYIRLFDTVVADFIVTDDIDQYHVPRKHVLVVDVASRRSCFVSPRAILHHAD